MGILLSAGSRLEAHRTEVWCSTIGTGPSILHRPEHSPAVQDNLPTNESSSPQHRSPPTSPEKYHTCRLMRPRKNHLGSSSEFFLANFIRANVNIETSTRSITPAGDDEATDSARFGCRACSRDLPSEQIARRLWPSYLNHDHLLPRSPCHTLSILET